MVQAEWAPYSQGSRDLDQGTVPLTGKGLRLVGHVLSVTMTQPCSGSLNAA